MDKQRLARRAGILLGLWSLIALSVAGQALARGMFFPAVTVDGPSSTLRSVADVDMALDGGGVVAYVRNFAGADHVFISSVVGGESGSPQRFDVGQPELIGEPAVGIADGGRMVVVFANKGGVWTRVRTGYGRPFNSAQKLAGAGAVLPTVDMTTLTGVAYAAWSDEGKVRAAYLPRQLTKFRVYSSALNINPAHDAGSGSAMRPKVSTSADGVGIVAFGERDGATSRVALRRLAKARLSNVVTSFAADQIGSAEGLGASSPDLVAEEDSSYAWLVFTQNFSDGVTRGVVRRLRASTLEPAQALGGGREIAPGTVASVALNGRGAGIASMQSAGGVVWSSLIRDHDVMPAQRIDTGGDVIASPANSFSASEAGLTTWLAGPSVDLLARRIEDDSALSVPRPFGKQTLLSRRSFGAVNAGGGIFASSDSDGNSLAAFTQGSGAARRVVLATYDLAPRAAKLKASSAVHRDNRPLLKWFSSTEAWPGLSYRVYLDGSLIATTSSTSVVPPRALSNGVHSWRVDSYDRRGQMTRSATVKLRIKSA